LPELLWVVQAPVLLGLLLALSWAFFQQSSHLACQSLQEQWLGFALAQPLEQVLVP